ncbi:hypothetical protein IAT38_006813 [Cryptococcus sp. DSM 104549]
MGVPAVITEQPTADTLLLYPVPSTLPVSPLPSLPPLVNALEAHLQQAPNAEQVPLPVLTTAMRQVTRTTHVLMNAARAGVAEAREELDGVDVELREVEYERMKIREELERCSGYIPAYEAMDLVGAETFLASAEQSVLDALPPKDDEGYEYALLVLRLEHELKEITDREARISELTKDRDALIRAKKEIKFKSDANDVHLSGFLKTAGAVAKKLVNVTEEGKVA